MSRDDAIARALYSFHGGAFRAQLARLVSMPTESQNPDRASTLRDYLDNGLSPSLEAMGFACRILAAGEWPFLFAERIERPSAPTVLGYGHGDVIRGLDDRWSDGLSPWLLSEREGRWYGRGVADNKGQHAINLFALRAVLETRGALGFNAKFLFEMGEEMGSPGLRAFCASAADMLRADVLIASDGPRLAADRPTIFLGSRGCITFDIWIDAREGGQHSGNWGGLLSDPAIQLAHALACIVGSSGEIRIAEWLPEGIPDGVRRALADCPVESAAGAPKIDPAWGEPGLSAAEKVFGWPSFTVLAMESGYPAAPVNAIAPRAWARGQLRTVVGIDEAQVLPALRRHLDRQGFPQVEVAAARGETFRATRLDPDHPWVRWAADSVVRTTGRRPAILPNLGGSLPNDVFAETLGLPTVWVPHSYPGCSQHAPNEHLPLEIVGEGLAIMAGLYFDLGEPGCPARAGAR